MNTTIYAYTEPDSGVYPAYVNLQKKEGGGYRLTVRSRGESYGSVIELTRTELQRMVQEAEFTLSE